MISNIYKIFILGCIFLCGCTDKHHHHTHASHICQEMRDDIYIEKYCPNCNGVGKVKLTTGERVLWGIVTHRMKILR